MTIPGFAAEAAMRSSRQVVWLPASGRQTILAPDRVILQKCVVVCVCDQYSCWCERKCT
jgi:hypothetical protein